MDSFNISLYRGDTKTITASLSIDGQDVDLSSYTVTLVYRNDGRLLASGVVKGKVATFNIIKRFLLCSYLRAIFKRCLAWG